MLQKTHCLILIFLALFTQPTNSQTLKNLAGEYKNGLYIYEDGTFIAGGIHAIVFGTVELNNNIVLFKKHLPKHKFALYGRKDNSRSLGNTIMFEGFEHNGLVNLYEKNTPLQVMQRVFNVGANCFSWPFFYDNKENSNKIYFADETDTKLYLFEIPEGYKDFVAFRFDLDEDPYTIEELYGQVSNDFNSITFYNSNEKIIKKPLSKEALEVKNLIATMYDRAYPEGEYYYCNPAYNIFEEEGIDIKNYKEIGSNGEGVFQLIGSEFQAKGDRLESDFHEEAIIYQYKKITPEIIDITEFSIIEQSIFTFKCD